MTLLDFLLGIAFVILIMAIVFALLFLFGYITLFCCRPCKHCGHSLEFKGIIQKPDGDVVFMQCPKCGRKEMIPKEKFFSERMKAEYNPNEMWP